MQQTTNEGTSNLHPRLKKLFILCIYARMEWM